jgi:hypothetical protein
MLGDFMRLCQGAALARLTANLQESTDLQREVTPQAFSKAHVWSTQYEEVAKAPLAAFNGGDIARLLALEPRYVSIEVG